MGRPRFRPIRNALAAITVVGAMILTIAAPAAATPWQKAWNDDESHQQWHDASWWTQNRHDWVITHHPESSEDYSGMRGQIGDSDRLHVWHYGAGGFDRRSNAVPTSSAMNETPSARVASSAKPDASLGNDPNLLENI
jgi:hypothetical protein